MKPDRNRNLFNIDCNTLVWPPFPALSDSERFDRCRR